ncbi:Rhodanese-like domain [Phytophthora cinnamomi]|uniref:Rhodanese-like domain n=1 Tax=Phytophthora cinnamomi TaxID=4785 RepID=UPI00355A7A02|nr:Rhodanese-like domain [Phytophthora cinnamomi]
MRTLRALVRLVPGLRRSPLLQRSLQHLPVAVTQQDSLAQRWFSSAGRVAGISRRQYISLYNYTPLDKKKLPKLRRDLREQWGDLGVVGRIYIAEEGVNGQLVVPEPEAAAFERSFPRLLRDAKLFYGQLIEDKPQSDEELKAAEPFHKLDVRIRDMILHDGFQGGPLDLKDSGNSLPPDQWHEKLKTRNDTQDSDTLVLDVRNFYEHEIGRFDGATRIMVDTFRDTFDALDEILEKHEKQHDGQKPKQVMMYCTGGIRCEKVGAYLTQYKGISNVQKLHGEQWNWS